MGQKLVRCFDSLRMVLGSCCSSRDYCLVVELARVVVRDQRLGAGSLVVVDRLDFGILGYIVSDS